MKQAEVTLTKFTVLRIAEDRHGQSFVDVAIEETGQERRLYVGENLELVVDLSKVYNQDSEPKEAR